MTDTHARIGRLTFYLAGFSLLLSMLAFWTDPVLNRDGMYYVTVARLAAEADALQVFSTERWLFMPVFLGGLSSILSVDALHVAIGYSVLCGLLMQLFAFRLFLRIDPQHPLLALLLAASFPALVEYRAYVIRDAGAWAAMLGAMLSMTIWWAQPRWRYLLAAFGFGLIAFLCRIEMIVILAAAGLVCLRGWHARGRFGALPLKMTVILAALVGLLLMAGLVLAVGLERIARYWSKTDGHLFNNFDRVVEELSGQVVSYLADDMGVVLGAGLVVLLIVKLISLNGIFIVPLAAGIRRHLASRLIRADGGMSLALAALVALVLLLFLFVNLFMTTRYVVPLSLALLPLLYLGLVRLEETVAGRVWRGLFVVVALLAVMDKAVSTGPGKRYLIEAGNWIAEHQAQLGQVYFTDQRVAFYAQQGYTFADVGQTLDDMPADATTVVLSYRADPDSEQRVIEQLRHDSGFAEILHRADNGDGDGVLVLGR